MAIVYPENAARRLSGEPRGNFERTYRMALRHSRRVRWLRIGVPIGIAVLLIGVVVIDYMPPIGGFQLPGELGKLVIHGTKITMQEPRLTGFTLDSRAYEFYAKAAAQDITKPISSNSTTFTPRWKCRTKAAWRCPPTTASTT